MSPLPRIALTLALACVAAPVIDAVWTSEARAEEASIDVGTQLVATEDITLNKAEILKGSRVSVTKLSKRDGQLSAVSVALADGAVVANVPLRVVHTSFRVAD